MPGLREQFRTILQNLEKNCDIHSEQWVRTGDTSHLSAYEHYKKEIIEIKEKIIANEKKEKQKRKTKK
tara:strand:- start:6925 stop:7128 length:204 start_codon:yes stop_codon:yes gene_type:complete